MGLALAMLGCAAPTPEADLSPEDVEFGLGDKADGVCDARALLCWSGADAEALRRYLVAQDELLVGAGDDGATARALLVALDDVSHKLEPSAVDAMPALRARAASFGDVVSADDRAALVVDVHQQVASRVATGYLSAHAVPLGAASSDTRADGWSETPALPAVRRDPDVIASLAVLKDSGPFGYAYALMMEHTGILDVDVDLWEEEFPFSEPREQRVDRIIERYTDLSTRDQVFVNLESLIPYAGIPLSIAHGTIAQFRHRLRMGIEIAAAYGVDIREGQNLLLVTGAVMGALDVPELRGLFGGVFALPALARAAGRLGGLLDPRAIVRALLKRAIDALIHALIREGVELGARAVTRAVGRAAGRQILGYATLGLVMIADVAVTRAATRAAGEHLDTMIRPWGAGMLTEDGVVARDRDQAACLARMFGAAMAVDGYVAPEERTLLAAHMSRFALRGGRFRPLAEVLDHGSQARAAAGGAADGEFERCVRDEYRGTDTSDRKVVLSWLLTMFAVDGHIGRGERAVWDDTVDLLRGDGWFRDGEELDFQHLEAIEARIETTFVSAADLLDDEAEALVADIDNRDLIEGIDAIDPAATRALACAFDGC